VNINVPCSTQLSEHRVQEGIFEVLNPRGIKPVIRHVPLAPRISDLNGKVVYLLRALRERTELEEVLEKAEEVLKKRFPDVEIVSKHKPAAYMNDEPQLWDEMLTKCDAFIYSAQFANSGTMWAATWTAKLEQRGLPGVSIIFDTFIDNARKTSEKMGTPVRYVHVPYPPGKVTDEEMADLGDRIVQSLTSPLTEKEKRTGMTDPPASPRRAFAGTLEQVQDYFSMHHWTDGLPIIPPTEERIAEMMKGTSHSRGEAVTTTMWPESLTVTVEKVAINGVMAGCRPEYMPVLLAAVEAFSLESFSSQVMSTNSFSFMQLVNGPIRKEIGMNPGTYALGPGNRANATIGRFLKLAITNLGEGEVGVNIMGTQGNPSGYSFCFPENEEASPWESYAVSKGHRPDESTITIFGGGWSHTGNYKKGLLDDMARAAAAWEWPNGVVVLLPPTVARTLARQGLQKKDVEEYFWKKATLTMKEFRNDPYYPEFVEAILDGKPMHGEMYLWPKEYKTLPDDARISVYPRKSVNVVVVGGEEGPYCQAWKMAYPVTRSIDKWR
jgi:hypothetical protein